MLSVYLTLAIGLLQAARAQNASTAQPMSTNTTGPALQLEHSFYDQMPTGIAVTSNGTMFVNYPIALSTSVPHHL